MMNIAIIIGRFLYIWVLHRHFVYHIILLLIEKDSKKTNIHWLIWMIMFSSLSRIRWFTRWFSFCKYSLAVLFCLGIVGLTFDCLYNDALLQSVRGYTNRKIETLCKWDNRDLHDRVINIIQSHLKAIK